MQRLSFLCLVFHIFWTSSTRTTIMIGTLLEDRNHQKQKVVFSIKTLSSNPLGLDTLWKKKSYPENSCRNKTPQQQSVCGSQKFFWDLNGPRYAPPVSRGPVISKGAAGNGAAFSQLCSYPSKERTAVSPQPLRPSLYFETDNLASRTTAAESKRRQKDVLNLILSDSCKFKPPTNKTKILSQRRSKFFLEQTREINCTRKRRKSEQ